MNRPQFLAELNQYLTFFTPDERAAVMASYMQKFDDAGETGEAALIVELGTPMRVAIDLKRRQEAGDSFDDLFGVGTAAAPDYSVETETPETLSAEAESGGEEPASAAEAAPDETSAESAQSLAEPPTRLSAGRIIIGVILSIVVVAVFLCIAATGALGMTAAGYFLMTGFSSLRMLTDALFLFAAGLVLGGAGLLIVWFAVWAAIRLISKLFSVDSRKGDAK